MRVSALTPTVGGTRSAGHPEAAKHGTVYAAETRRYPAGNSDGGYCLWRPRRLAFWARMSFIL